MRRLKVLLGMALATWLLGGVVALGDSMLRNQPDASGTTSATADWGSEAIGHFADNAPFLALIRVANACGLGTSSCARCHDGRRAAAPPKDDTTGPWHRDHARVSYSCAGCHKGNPRVMRQDVAHKNMIAQPLKAPDQHCRDCHKAESAALARRYLSILPSSP